MTMLSPQARMKIANRKPLSQSEDPHLVAYRTTGNSYIVASNGKQNDRPGIVDLVLVQPDGNVIPLRPTVNPQLVEEIAELVR